MSGRGLVQGKSARAAGALVVAAALWAAAQAPAPPLMFVRVTLPEEAKRKLKEQGDYLPLERDRFDEMLARVASVGAQQSPARLIAARYEARLDEDTLTGLDARLSIEHQGDQPTFLPLEPCRLAFAEASWAGEPPQTAELGQDEQGRIGVTVPAAGELKFRWSLRGKSRTGGSEFALQLPACAQTQLLLHLPERTVPKLQQGIVARAGDSETPMGYESWLLELGAAAENRLRIEPLTDSTGEPDLAQDVTYRLTPGGLQMQADLRLSRTRPRELQLRVSPGLRIEARVGDERAPIQQVDPQQAVIRLPSQGAGDVVRVTGFAELPRDVLWTIPSLTVTNARWQQGQTVLLVSSSLRVRRLQLDGSRQTSRVFQPQGEELRFRHERPDAAIRVEIGDRGVELLARSGITVRWSDRQLEAETVSEIESKWGEEFDLRFSFPPQWEIDSVETVPAEALDSDRLQLLLEDGLLHVPLSMPVAPGAPLKVTISSRRPSPANLTLSGPQLLAGKLVNAAHDAYLSIQGELENDHDLARVDPTRDPAARLVRPITGGVVFREGSAIDQLRVAPPPQSPEYLAEIQVEVVPREALIDERYTVRCVPESGPIPGVRVQMTPAEEQEPLAWELGDGTPVRVRPAGPDEMPGRWDLSFATPQSEPFELRATRQRPFEDEIQVGLASLPEAVAQSGTVMIRNTGTLVRTVSEDLEKLPLPLPQAGEQSEFLTAFRYEPSTPEPLVVTPLRVAAARAHAWSQHLVTRCDRQGNAVHAATFQLESFGHRALSVELPDGSDLLRASLDGVPLPGARGPVVNVRLPAGGRYASLRVEYRSRHGQLGIAGAAEAPLLKLSVPVHQTHWSVLLPPGYEGAWGESTVVERLAGPFAWLVRSTPMADSRTTEAIGVLRTLHAQAGMATWGQLLREYQGLVEARAAPPLLVHVASMRNRDMSPSTPLADRFRDLLAQHGLRLRPVGDAVVLAGVSQASDAWIDECVEAGQWARRVAMPSPWPNVELVSRDIDGNWQRIERLVSPDEVQRGIAVAPVRRRASRQALASALMLLVAAAGVLLRRLRVALALCLCGWATAWLGPAPWDLYGASIAWGAALGALLQCAWPNLSFPNRPAVPAAALALAAAVLLADALLLARPLGADDAPPGPVVHRVLLAEETNEDGEPLDPYAWLPREFWYALHRLERQALAAPKGWLIDSADYEVDLPGETGSEASLTARYQVRVLQGDTTVSLPIAPAAAAALLRTTLDGEDAVFRWNEAGDRLSFQASAARRYDVEVVTRPQIESTPDGQRVQLGIPALPQSSLVVSTPESVEVTSVSALGAVRDDQLDRRIEAELGAASQLTVQWRPSGEAPAALAQVEEHLWMQIRPNNVILETLCRFQADRPISQVQLQAEPGLRLFSMKVGGEDVSPQSQEQADGTLLTATVPSPARRIEVRASFQVRGASGIGRVRPPRVSAVSSGPSRRWFALSVYDPNLQGEIVGEVASIDSEEFIVSWPEAAGTLQAVRFSPDSEFFAAITYAADEAVATQATRLALSQRRTEIRYDAELRGLHSLVHQHLLKVPPQLDIESLEVLEAGQPVAQRHEMDSGGNLTVFLDQPAAAQQQIELRATMPAVGARSRPRVLPRVELVSAAVEARRIDVFARSDLSGVRIVNPSNLEVDTSGEGDYSPDAGRRVATLIPQQPAYDAQLSITPNNRTAEALLLTKLTRERNQWLVEVHGHVDVSRGQVDVLRLRVPGGWGRLLETPQGVETTLTKVGEENELRLIPERPVRGPFAFRLRAQLANGAEGVTRAPNVELRGLETRRFLTLPRQIEGQQFAWITRRGLQATELPEPLSALAPDDPLGDVFEVVDRRFEAIVQRVERVAGAPMVRLADVRLSWNGRRCHGVVLLDIEPAGVDHCEVEVPDSCELAVVTVDGVAVDAAPQADRRWRVPLGPDQLPQRLALSYHGQLNGGPDEVLTLPAPTVADMPTVRTLWTVQGPYGGPGAVPLPRAFQDSPARLEIYRLEAISGLLETAADVAAESPTGEIANWYTPWARRLADCRRRLARMPLNDEQAVRVKTFLQDQQLVAAKLRMSETLRQAGDSPPQAASLADIRRVSQMPPTHLLYASQQGASAKLPIRLQRTGDRRLSLWLVSLLAAVAAARFLPLDAWHAQWPALGLALAGAGALLMLPWPWIGWTLLCLAMLLAARR